MFSFNGFFLLKSLGNTSPKTNGQPSSKCLFYLYTSRVDQCNSPTKAQVVENTTRVRKNKNSENDNGRGL